MVEFERAKLGMGVRFSSTALGVSCSRAGSLARNVVCKTAVPGSIPGRLSGEGKELFIALDAQRKGGRLLNGSLRVRLPPRALGSPFDLPCPHLARWPRQPDSQSGNAGSNPAGDAGLICRPVCFFGGPRLGGRACQRSITPTAPRRTARWRSRAAARSASLFSLSRRPGIGLRTRLARFDSSQRGQLISAAFSRAAPCPCSRGTRHKPPKLVAQVRFLAGAPQEGTVPTEAHNLDSAGSIPAPASAAPRGERRLS
jgi:hypothetical protein